MQEVNEEVRNMVEKELLKDAEGTLGSVQAEMPKYKSHKEVWALKIKSIRCIPRAPSAVEGEPRETDGSAMITPEEAGYAPLRVDHEYMRKHNPQVGGYYVVYADGYQSFSPADAFEDGYTRI